MSYQELQVIEALSPRERVEQRIRAAELAKADECNVHVIRDRIEGSKYKVREHFWAANIVTNVGDVFYAQMAAGETPTNNFAGSANTRLCLRTAAMTPAKADNYGTITANVLAGSHKTKTSGYPRTNDPDALNNVTNKTRKVTWKFEYLTSEANHATIYGGAIHLGGASPVAGTVLMTHFTFSGTVPFAKTSSDTLTGYVNHELLGA